MSVTVAALPAGGTKVTLTSTGVASLPKVKQEPPLKKQGHKPTALHQTSMCIIMPVTTSYLIPVGTVGLYMLPTTTSITLTVVLHLRKEH